MLQVTEEKPDLYYWWWRLYESNFTQNLVSTGHNSEELYGVIQEGPVYINQDILNKIKSN
jgi:hypothetical protein